MNLYQPFTCVFIFKAGGYKLPFFTVGGMYYVLALPILLILVGFSRKFTIIIYFNVVSFTLSIYSTKLLSSIIVINIH